MRLPRAGPWAAILVAVPLVAAAVAAAWLAKPDEAAPREEAEALVPREDGVVRYAALGDSITAAAGVRGFGEYPAHSWATGANGTDGVASIAERLRATGVDVRASNLAESGARASDLERQARLAAQGNAELVTVLVGANDACARAFDPDAFRVAIRRALDALPESASVVVLAIPDVPHLASLRATDLGALASWAAFRTCPAILSPGLAPGERLAGAARVGALNAILEEEAAAHGARWTNGTGASDWGLAEVSTWDFFHPSLRGQARIAEAAWPTVQAAMRR